MARHGKRGTNHLVGTIKALGERETVDDKGEKTMKPAWQINALCNDQYAKRTTFVEPGKIDYPGFAKFAWGHDTCPRCQSIFYSKLLKEMGPKFPYYLGERYDMSQPLPFGISKWTWKSVYPVFERGVLADRDDPSRIVAFICIENGWGKSWSVHGWEPQYGSISTLGDPNFSSTPKMCSEPAQVRMYDYIYDDAGYRKVDRTREPNTYRSISGNDVKFMKTDAKNYNSKEDALLSIVQAAVEDGDLKSYADCLEIATSSKERLAREIEEREVKRQRYIREAGERKAQENEEKVLIKDGLLALAERTDLGNIEREAVFLAYRHILGAPLTQEAAAERRQELSDTTAPQEAAAPAGEAPDAAGEAKPTDSWSVDEDTAPLPSESSSMGEEPEDDWQFS